MNANSGSSCSSVSTRQEYKALVESIVEDHTHAVDEGPRSVANILIVDVCRIDGELVVLRDATPYSESRLWPMEVIKHTYLPSTESVDTNEEITGREIAVNALERDLKVQYDEHVT